MPPRPLGLGVGDDLVKLTRLEFGASVGCWLSREKLANIEESGTGIG